MLRSSVLVRHFASSKKLGTKDAGKQPFVGLLSHMYLFCDLSFSENSKAWRGKPFENTVGQLCF